MITIESLLTEAYRNWDDFETLVRTGRELHDRNRLPASCEVLERAVALRPEASPDAWGTLSFAYMRGFEHEKGLEALRRGIAATGSDELRSTLASYTKDEGEAKRLREIVAGSELPSIRAAAASQRFHDGEHEPALAEIRALREAHPDDEDVAHTFCWMMMNGKGMGVVDASAVREEAIPVIDGRIEEEPDRVWSRTMKLMMLAGLEDWRGLLEATEESLARFPDEETHWQFRGRAFREMGDHLRAAAALSRAIGAKPSFAGARVDLGKTYEAMDRLDLAEEVFRETPVANPGYPGGTVSLALFLARRERWDEAETLLLEAWPRLPDWMRKVLPANPAAKALLDRPRVRALFEAD
jgi:tetratricopeptide (TPR) repeat protein